MIKRRWGFLFLCLLLFFAIFTSIENNLVSAQREIIFEDNFENYGNWNSTSAFGTSIGSKNSAPFNLAANFSKAGWVNYRQARTANQVGDPVWCVSSERVHSGSKSLKYELENTYNDWNGGGMTLYLGGENNSKSGEKELYISAWVKFEDNFVLPYLRQGFAMKLMRVYYGVNADLETGMIGSEMDFRNWRRLESFIDYAGNGYILLKMIQNPNYRVPYGTIGWLTVNSTMYPRPGASYSYLNWTRVMYHIKLNTDGNFDGLLELYIGDTKVSSINNVMLVNTSEGPIENNKVNDISIPDNYFQIADGIPGYANASNPVATNPGEVAFYMDDLVISREYVPLDYYPGKDISSGGVSGDLNSDGKVSTEEYVKYMRGSSGGFWDKILSVLRKWIGG